MIYPTLPQSIAIIVAFTAKLTDSSSGRIYNWLTFPAILAGWLVNFYLSGLDGFGLSLAGTFAGIFLYLPFAAINLLTDLAYGLLDPRIRFTAGRRG